jgi:hypothetical protein
LAALTGARSAEPSKPLTYAEAYAQAVATDKPLVVLVGDAKAIGDAGVLSVRVDRLPGYNNGDIIVSAPAAGKLYWAATYTDPAAVVIPKKVAVGCSSGYCSFTYFPAAPCPGASCSGPASCSACGQCGNACGQCLSYPTYAVGTGTACGQCSSCPACSSGQCQQCPQSGFRFLRR